MINGAAIEEIRRQKGKTQAEVARALSIVQSAYSNKVAKSNFDDEEIKIICKLLGIKKEQIEASTELDQTQYLVHKAIFAESALRVMMSTQAEILAKLNGGTATKYQNEMVATANDLTLQALKKLGISNENEVADS
jgi:transcriptional regulator with XRE-family HTH domain